MVPAPPKIGPPKNRHCDDGEAKGQDRALGYIRNRNGSYEAFGVSKKFCLLD
jgi:hypothetical protein